MGDERNERQTVRSRKAERRRARNEAGTKRQQPEPERAGQQQARTHHEQSGRKGSRTQQPRERREPNQALKDKKGHGKRGQRLTPSASPTTSKPRIPAPRGVAYATFSTSSYCISALPAPPFREQPFTFYMTVIVCSYGIPFSPRFPSRPSTDQFRVELCPGRLKPDIPPAYLPHPSTRDALGWPRIARKMAGRVTVAAPCARVSRPSKDHHPSPPGEGLRVHLLYIPPSSKISLFSPPASF